MHLKKSSGKWRPFCLVLNVLTPWPLEDTAILKLIFSHDDVTEWKHFPRYWSFVRENHRSPVNSPHKGQWRGALMFTLICTRINGWVNNREAGDLRRNRAHYDVIVMTCICFTRILHTLVELTLGDSFRLINVGSGHTMWYHYTTMS